MTSNLNRVLVGAALLLGIAPAALRAQQATVISGTVTSETNTPLQGASVSIPSLNIGAYTSANGRYTFTVPATYNNRAVTLTARRIGYQPKSTQITLSGAPLGYDFALVQSATQLTGIVVTALGRTAEKSTLGTAQQQLTSSDLNQTRAQNILNQIEGKVSGVTITGSGTQGGSTNIIIRGQNSITGNNQPLFVVDGIPISNADRGGDPNGSYDFGSAIADLNPDDIETMSVLKGPNAAALYGSRAANGVIVITTKKGRSTGGRIRTEISSTYTFERPSILPDYQNQYGQGAEGEFQFVNGAGDGVNDGYDQSFGPKLDGRLIDQFTGKAQPWVAHPDNVKSFFQTGHTFSNTLAASGGTERANARLSLGSDNVQGYIPNNYFSKLSGLLSGNLQVTNRIDANATLQYIRNAARNRPGVGYNAGILEQFIWFGRQVDMDALKNYQQGGAVNGGPANREYNWNYNYHNNPWWLMDENPIADTRDRFIGTVSVNYKLTDWLNLLGRTGSDIYRYNIDQRWGEGNLTWADPSYEGAFAFTNDYRNENNSDFLLSASRQTTSALALNATLGGAIRNEQFNTQQQTTAGIIQRGIYNVSNAAIPPTLAQNVSRRRVNSIYGSASFTWNGWWTVEGTARNDWSSTLPRNKNSYFYPSVNTSVVLTDALPALRNRVLSYAKLRGSLAQVGNDAAPYQLSMTFTGIPSPFRGLPQATFTNAIANPALKPEQTKSGEVGLELGFFDGRATLDATYYGKSTTDQIFNLAISPTTGFSSKVVNAGRIDNKGFEGLLTVTPVRMQNGFEWTSSFSYSANRSRVVNLYPGIKTIVLGSSWYTNVEARQGEPYGSIFGYAFARDEATGQLSTDGGYPYVGGRQILGNIQPTWTGGWNNQFTYKNWTVSGLLDIRRGGDIVSISNFFGEYSGVLKSTLKGREVDWDNPGYLVHGIDVNTGTANTDTLTAEQYFQNIFPVMEPYVYKANWVKLRELRIGYDLPQRWAAKFNATAANIAFTGRNLFTSTNVPNIDPEFAYTTGNSQGMEFAALPNPRTFGISVRVTP